jgi:O-antigen biosynthesis alpha-1,3-mannosyltransferase
MRTAIVHDWLIVLGGAERALEEILGLFPEADLFCIADFLAPNERAFLSNRSIHSSFVQRLPFARRKYRSYLPLMPLAIEQFDLSSYDIVISSSHAVAKGVLTRPGQLHISYVYTPSRYAWDMQSDYLDRSQIRSSVRSMLARLILHYFRLWDYSAASRVDTFVAISDFVAERVRKLYRRDATVIYPPVHVDAFSIHHDKEPFYLTVSRLVPYKRVDLIVEAFARMPERRLIVIGDGPELPKIRKMAAPNVSILGRQSFNVVRDHMQRARAFVFAAQEDFGIAPVEAQACGTPVIAYGRGGAVETVIDGQTGIFFHEQSAPALVESVRRFEAMGRFDPLRIRANAKRFSSERFRHEFARLVIETWKGFSATARRPEAAHAQPTRSSSAAYSVAQASSVLQSGARW